MKSVPAFPAIVMLALITLGARPQTPMDPLKSRSELTNYEETSRYDDVVAFFNQLQRRTSLMRLEKFGESTEGRALPLAILSDPPIAQPREARVSGKPIVFVLANIHAGEVEGKEAAQHLARRLLNGDLRPLLKKLIILIVPIYNADGNERIDLTNRVPQNGPIGGVGKRENAQGLDLNRDFIKLEAPETQSLIRLCNRWDPHIMVDLHTTDGSYHGYHLTYSIPLNPSVDPKLIDYHRDKLMPALAKAMSKQHSFRTYYYGNFANTISESAKPNERAWFAFSHQPRVGVNYFGFRNRLSILSEAYSYLDFRRRVEVTEAFVEEIFRYAAAHGPEIRRLTQQADVETIQRGLTGPALEIGVDYKPKALPKPVSILVGKVTKIKNPRSGRQMTAMIEDQATPVKMLDYGMFEATRTVPTAGAYLFRREQGLQMVLDKLLAHGITVEELAAPATLEVKSFRIEEVKMSQQLFQGHHEVTLKGRYEDEKEEFLPGTVLVRCAQSLGLLAAYLLEPESGDGLVTWNFLDSFLEKGRVYPIYQVTKAVRLPTRIVK